MYIIGSRGKNDVSLLRTTLFINVFMLYVIIGSWGMTEIST